METPTLDYATPARPRSALTSGGLADTIALAGGAVGVIGLHLPEGFRVLLTWVLLLLSAWYVVDRLLTEPNRERIVRRWAAASIAILFVSVQIWWFKDQQMIKQRGWSLSFVWPSLVALGSVGLFAMLSRVRRPAVVPAAGTGPSDV